MNLVEQFPDVRKRKGIPMTRVSDYEPTCQWDYTVKGFLRRGEVSLMFGPPNCGKSAFAVMLSSTIAAGRPFQDARTRSGLVVYVASESPQSILDRFSANEREYGVGEFPGDRLLVVQIAVNLGDSDAVASLSHEIEREAAGVSVALIVFDTLALSIGDLNENNPGEMTLVVQNAQELARRHATHVMLIHHTGKDDTRGYRGTSALKAAVDTEIRLEAKGEKPRGEGESAGVVVNVSLDKQRTMPRNLRFAYSLKPVQLGIDEDGDDFTSVVAVPVQPTSPDRSKAEPSSNERMVALRTILQVRRGIGAVAFKAADLVAEFPAGALAGKPDSQRRAVDRLLETLAKTQPALIERTSDGWRLL